MSSPFAIICATLISCLSASDQQSPLDIHSETEAVQFTLTAPIDQTDSTDEADEPVREGLDVSTGANESEPARNELTVEQRRLRDRIELCLARYYPKHVDAELLRPWSIMHGLLAYGQDSLILSGGKKVDAVDYLCANGRGNDANLLSVENGLLTVKKGRGVQGHDGQFLAMLAQVNVPVDHPIRVDGRSFTIHDLIRHEQRGCRPATELTFRLIGLAHYLDSDAMWKNDLGQGWSIERLIREEIIQPINGAACGGTHRLMALSYAVQKRREQGKPIVGQWKRAESYVEEYHDYTFDLQNEDGSFSTDWFVGRSDNGKPEDKLRTTGHILEWLLYSLPAERMDDPHLAQAADYLADNLLNDNIGVGPLDVGPKCHALRALRLYEYRVFGEVSDHHRFASDKNIVRNFNTAQKLISQQQKYLDRLGGKAGLFEKNKSWNRLFRRR